MNLDGIWKYMEVEVWTEHVAPYLWVRKCSCGWEGPIRDNWSSPHQDKCPRFHKAVTYKPEIKPCTARFGCFDNHTTFEMDYR